MNAKKKIAIVTTTGHGYGSGHIQRMATLVSLLSAEGFRVQLIAPEVPPFIIQEKKCIIQKSIDPDSDFIIRDMRDSSIEEISVLQKIAPVCVIDDCGPGRSHAQYTIDLLPNTSGIYDMDFAGNHFLYGYTFINSIRTLTRSVVKKEIDVAIYAGFNPDEKLIDYYIQCIPSGSSIVLFSGNDYYRIINGKKNLVQNMNYAELLLQTKVLVTHFGILLFEGYISKCGLVTINPSPYHSDLSNLMREKMDIVNLSVLNEVVSSTALNKITSLIKDRESYAVSARDVYEAISRCHQNFIQHICQYL